MTLSHDDSTINIILCIINKHTNKTLCPQADPGQGWDGELSQAQVQPDLLQYHIDLHKTAVCLDKPRTQDITKVLLRSTLDSAAGSFSMGGHFTAGRVNEGKEKRQRKGMTENGRRSGAERELKGREKERRPWSLSHKNPRSTTDYAQPVLSRRL